MENQINIDGQNTQQIAENPVGQPVKVPPKTRTNYWMVSTVLLLSVVLLCGAWLLLSIKSKTPLSQQTSSTQGEIVPSKPVNSKFFLQGKIIYNKRGTAETTIVDFDRKQTFNTGIKAYFGEGDLSQMLSPDQSKILLPGEEVGPFNLSPISMMKNLFVKDVYALARDTQVHLFVVDLSNKQRQQIIGNFLVGLEGSRFVWIDDSSFCYKEIDVMRPTYKKFWRFDLAGNKNETKETNCPFPNPSESLVTQKYILDESTYQGGYESKIKNPDTNEEVILKPDSSCASVPQAVLSPDRERIAFACEPRKDELINKYIYILPVKDVFLRSYEKAIKIAYENDPYLQWIDDSQLLLTSAIGYKSAGEMWNTAEILLIRLDGSQQELVSRGTKITEGPIIAPEKNAFIYETIAEDNLNESRNGNEEIVIMSLDKRILYRIPGTHAKWIR
jgi:hypothetical protein